MSERRTVMRYIVGVNVSYLSEHGRDQGWTGCRLLDLSEAGAGLEIYDVATDELRTGELTVDFEIGGPRGRGKPVGGVIRNAVRGPSGGTCVGVEFGALSQVQRAMLVDVLALQPAV